MSGDVYILGASMTRFRRYPDAPVEQLGAESAVAALADADLSIQDAQALYAGNV